MGRHLLSPRPSSPPATEGPSLPRLAARRPAHCRHGQYRTVSGIISRFEFDVEGRWSGPCPEVHEVQATLVALLGQAEKLLADGDVGAGGHTRPGSPASRGGRVGSPTRR